MKFNMTKVTKLNLLRHAQKEEQILQPKLDEGNREHRFTVELKPTTEFREIAIFLSFKAQP